MNLIELMIMLQREVLRRENLLSIEHISVCGDSSNRIWRVNSSGLETSLENCGYRVSGMGIDTSALRQGQTTLKH